MEGLTDDHICNRCGPYYTTGVKPEFHYRNNKSIVINKQTVMQIVIPATLTNGLSVFPGFSSKWFLSICCERVRLNNLFDIFKAFVYIWTSRKIFFFIS